MSPADAKPPVVGELVLAVVRTFMFSKSYGELGFLFSTVLAGSRGFWRSCAPDVPFAVEDT